MGIRFGVPCSLTADFRAFLTNIKRQGATACQIGPSDNLMASFTPDLLQTIHALDIGLVFHLDFWFNIGNLKTAQNLRFLLQATTLAEKTGGIGILHPGYFNNCPIEAIENEAERLFSEALSDLPAERPILAIENDGNRKAIGELEHLLRILEKTSDKRLTITLDFGHFFARSNGKYPYTVDDFKEILVKTEEALNYKPFLFHVEGIKYNNGSELRHISLKANEPPFPHLCMALQELNYKNFTMIIETPDAINDLLWAREVWTNAAEFAEKVPLRKARDLFDYF